MVPEELTYFSFPSKHLPLVYKLGLLNNIKQKKKNIENKFS